MLKKSYNEGKRISGKIQYTLGFSQELSQHSLCPIVPSHQSSRTYWKPPPALPACCRAPEAQVVLRRRPSWLLLLCWLWSLSPPGPGCGLLKKFNQMKRWQKYHHFTCIQYIREVVKINTLEIRNNRSVWKCLVQNVGSTLGWQENDWVFSQNNWSKTARLCSISALEVFYGNNLTWFCILTINVMKVLLSVSYWILLIKNKLPGLLNDDIRKY